MAGRLRWYAHRLAAMSIAEVFHRIFEQGRRRRSAGQTWSWREDGELPVFPGLRDRLLALPPEDFPEDLAERLLEAGRKGTYACLGRTWPPCGEDPRRWHLDPVTVQHWPSDAYCFDIPFRHTDEFGDVKYVWEINRLQHLQVIAALAARRGDRDAAAFCRREIASWIAANPPFRGVNWASGIELALRVVSLLVVVSFLGPDAFPDEERQRLKATLAAHGYWIHRFPSRFSSANNHLVAEAGALYLLATLSPDLPGAAAWRSYGRTTLIEEIGRQIHADGVGAEQSPTYAAFSLEWWLLAMAAGDAVGEPFPKEYRQRIQNAGLFLSWILDDADHHPRIGDDDEGRVIAAMAPPQNYVATILDALAAAINRPELKPRQRHPHLWRTVFSVAAGGGSSPEGVATFAAGGYSIVRESVDGRRLLLVFDHGPLGYLAIAAHGHADALGVWLHVDGQPVLVDAGTFLYHSGGRWRDHFRGTAAHNTLLVGGADSSRISGPFNWSRKARAALLTSDTSPGRWHFEAEHDGYPGVRHRRRVACEGEGTVAIVDQVCGGKETCGVEAGFLVHPDLAVEPLQDGFLIRSARDPVLSIRHEGGMEARLERGLESPIRGWYSPEFGTRQPAARLVFTGRLAPQEALRVVLRVASGDRI